MRVVVAVVCEATWCVPCVRVVVHPACVALSRGRVLCYVVLCYGVCVVL